MAHNLTDPMLPKISSRLLGGFRWFVGWYLRKNFHAVAVNSHQLRAVEIGPSDSFVVFANHASWWDPLTAIFVAERLFPRYAMYAPIDAEALKKYQMFGRMGFFGVEQKSLRGASEFLRMAETILQQPAASLWVTPEGRFADVRDAGAELMPGLAHLAHRFSRAEERRETRAAVASPRGRVWFVPAAVEYTFWEERQPELLMWLGRPLATAEMFGKSKHACSATLTAALRAAQSQLAQAAIARDSLQFEVLIGGNSGSFVIYDWWRQLRGWVAGKRIRVEHGQKLSR